MRVVTAFLVAEATSAVIYAAEFAIESATAAKLFLVFVVVNMIVGLPFVLLAGVPIWLILRARRIRAYWIFALVGATLGLCAYLLLVKMGMSAPSDRPMTFAENIGRSFHIPRIGAAMLAGGTGSMVFRAIATGRATGPNR